MVESRWLTDNAHPGMRILGLLVSNVYHAAKHSGNCRDGTEKGAKARHAMPNPEGLDDDLDERPFPSATST